MVITEVIFYNKIYAFHIKTNLRVRKTSTALKWRRQFSSLSAVIESSLRQHLIVIRKENIHTHTHSKSLTSSFTLVQRMVETVCTLLLGWCCV